MGCGVWGVGCDALSKSFEQIKNQVKMASFSDVISFESRAALPNVPRIYEWPKFRLKDAGSSTKSLRHYHNSFKV